MRTCGPAQMSGPHGAHLGEAASNQLDGAALRVWSGVIVGWGSRGLLKPPTGVTPL